MFQKVEKSELNNVIGGKDYKVSCEVALYNNKGYVGGVDNLATVQTIGQAFNECQSWLWANPSIKNQVVGAYVNGNKEPGKGYMKIYAKPKKGSTLYDIARY